MSRSRSRRFFDVARPVIFWCHLATGTAIGLVVLIMSATGVALAYQRQILEWSAGGHQVRSPPPANRLALDTLLARARGAAAERKIAGLTVRADRLMPVSATLEDRSSLFLDPYTGTVIGSDAGLRTFFSTVERVHRSIVFQGTTRSPTGTAVTGAANLAFLFLILSGFVLWWPRQWSAQAFRRVLLFTRGAGGKVRDWTWHHVLGFWSAPVLILIVASAAFISYDWPQKLVERAFGQAPTRAGNRSADRPAGREQRSGGRDTEPDSGAVAALSLDSVWAQAIEKSAPWHSVQLRLPSEAGQPLVVNISHTAAFRPDQRSSVTVDTRSGAVERRRYQGMDPARKFRAWMRPLHTGEVAGIPGQTLAALVSAAATVLVCTGLALVWRRLRAALRRREDSTSNMKTAAIPMVNDFLDTKAQKK